MNHLQSRILLIMFLLVACASKAQVPTPDEIWGGILKATNADIFSYGITQNEKNKSAAIESISNQLNDLRGVFDKPYSAQTIENSIEKILQIISNPSITEAQAKDAERLYLKMLDYEAAAHELYCLLILESDNETLKNTRTFLSMNEEMVSAFVTTMSEEITEALNNKGLSKMTIDKAYTYLNERLNYVKDNLALLVDSESKDVNQLINQLRSVLNTVNEISPEFPIVEIIINQDLKN